MEASHHPEIKVDPPDVKETTDETLSRLRKNPVMTEIGKKNLVETLKNQIKGLSKRLTRQLSVITPLLQSSDVNKVNNETSMLDRIYQDVIDTHGRLCGTLNEETDGEEFREAATVLDEIDNKYFEVKGQLCTWQLEFEKSARAADEASSQGSSRSKGSSRSGKSRKSKVSKTSSRESKHSNKSLELKAKIAGLKAESEAIKKTGEAELTVLLLKKEQKIRKMEAMEKVYAESDQSDEGGEQIAKKEEEEVKESYKLEEEQGEPPKKKAKRSKHKKSKPKDESETKQHTAPSTSNSTDSSLQHAVAEMIKLQSAPKPDLDVFSGDPLSYPYFKASFREVVENAVAQD